jgi:hypothetical protein
MTEVTHLPREAQGLEWMATQCSHEIVAPLVDHVCAARGMIQAFRRRPAFFGRIPPLLRHRKRNRADLRLRHANIQIGDRRTIGYGREECDLPSSTGTLDVTELAPLHVNALHGPTDDMTFGAGYIFGERSSSTGATVNGDRVPFSARLTF